MDLIELSLGILIGVIFASGMMSLFLAFRNFERRINLSYFFLSLALMLNSYFSIMRSHASELTYWIRCEKLQNFALILVGISILVFMHFLANSYSRKRLLLNIVPMVFFLFVNHFSNFGLAYSSVSSITYNPGSDYFFIVNGVPSIWVWPAIIYLCYMLYDLGNSIYMVYKNGDKRTAFLIGISIGIPVSTVAFNLFFVSQSYAYMPFIENVGLSMMILVITHRNFTNVIKSGEIKVELQKSEERYRSLIEHMPDAVVVHLNGKILYVNKRTLDLVGVKDPKELEGKTVIDFVHPDYKQLALERMVAFDSNSSLAPVDLKIIRADGEIVDIDIRGVITTFNNSPAWQTVIRDISAKKKAEQDLRKFVAAVEQSSVGIVITTPNGVIEYLNPKFTEICGYSSDDLLGKPTRYLKSGAHDRAFYENLWKSLLSGKEWNGEICNRKASGELYWEMDFISSVKTSDGKISHFIAIKEDITERKRLNEELIRSKEEAEEADRLKSTLLANMSHEFRTPLNGILGFAQILQDEITEFLHLEFIQKITKSALRLSNTLNSVLMITELENKNYLLANTRINLNEFCKEIGVKYEKSAVAKNLNYYINLPQDNIIIETDGNILSKILTALLENAIKYTTRGSIILSLELNSNDKESPDISIKVSDSGIGIREEHQSIIFREFKQISEGYTRAYEGLGLGLTLAQKMAKLLEYEITVKSKYGEGSEFTLFIPAKNRLNYELDFQKLPHNKVLPAIQSEKLPRVLLVEDNSINVEVVEYFLKGKCILDSAATGEKALDMALREKYDLLLLDIHHGEGMDGTMVLLQLRAGTQYKTVPAVALTGYASDSSRLEFLDKGFNYVLTKPFNKAQLNAVIDEVFPVDKS